AQFGSLIPFLEAAERYLGAGDFDWGRDVVGLHGVTAPVQPERVDYDHGDADNGKSARPVAQTGLADEKQAPREAGKAPPVETAGNIAPACGPSSTVALPVEDPAAAAAPAPRAGKEDAQPNGTHGSRAAWDAALGEAVRVAKTAIGGEPAP